MSEQRCKGGWYNTPWKDVFWSFPCSVSWTPMLIYINKLSSLLLSLMLLLKVDKGGDSGHKYTYKWLWDTWVINYMTILLYSYITPVLAKKKSRETKQKQWDNLTLLWTVSTEHSKRYKSQQIGDSAQRLFLHLVRDSDGKTSIIAADMISSLIANLLLRPTGIRDSSMHGHNRPAASSFSLHCFSL